MDRYAGVAYKATLFIFLAITYIPVLDHSKTTLKDLVSSRPIQAMNNLLIFLLKKDFLCFFVILL